MSRTKLATFLSAGSKPIYIGFGSTVGGDFDQALSIVLESLKERISGLFCQPAGEMMKGVDLPDTVMQGGMFRTAGCLSGIGRGSSRRRRNNRAGIRAGVPSTSFLSETISLTGASAYINLASGRNRSCEAS
jgi:hypothetical protein